MPLKIASRYTATLTLPVSGNPVESVRVGFDANSRAITLEAVSDKSPAEAAQRIREFLDAARLAAQEG